MLACARTRTHHEETDDPSTRRRRKAKARFDGDRERRHRNPRASASASSSMKTRCVVRLKIMRRRSKERRERRERRIDSANDRIAFQRRRSRVKDNVPRESSLPRSSRTDSFPPSSLEISRDRMSPSYSYSYTEEEVILNALVTYMKSDT